jgi:hypothetical protein
MKLRFDFFIKKSVHKKNSDGWKLVLLLFSGSWVFKVEKDHLKTTAREMQHDSTLRYYPGVDNIAGYLNRVLKNPEFP